MGNETNNLDDLISSSGGAPIIVQEGSGDKKILYILLIALLVLFILAIGLIAFLGGKYFSQDRAGANAKSAVVAPVKTVTAKSEAVTDTTAQASKNEVSDLEKMVKEEEAKQSENNTAQPKVAAVKKPTAQEQAIQSAATATTGKALSQADLAKIAALVAQELAKSKAAAPKSTSATPKATVKQDDAALAAALESAQTDTLKNEKTAAPQKLTANVKAGSNKKVDTFNKVVVGENGGGDDEVSKLSQEIDSILQSDEVAKNQSKETVTLKKELQAEADTRQAEMRFIVVKKGDTLSSIANRAYGRASAYTKIYAANPDIVRNPNRIYIGMRLRVPVDQEYKSQQGK